MECNTPHMRNKAVTNINVTINFFSVKAGLLAILLFGLFRFYKKLVKEKQLIPDRVRPIGEIVAARTRCKFMGDVPHKQLLMKIHVHFIKKVFRTAVEGQGKLTAC